jgi:hypothetical protein
MAAMLSEWFSLASKKANLEQIARTVVTKITQEEK